MHLDAVNDFFHRRIVNAISQTSDLVVLIFYKLSYNLLIAQRIR